MKLSKRLLLVLLLLTTVGLLLRGWFYRQLVTYKSIGVRTAYPATDKALRHYIDANAAKPAAPDIQQIIDLSLAKTSAQLQFTADKNHNDPNKLIRTKKAHCVGYAAFFATTCNHLLHRYGLADTWAAKPQIGQLYVLGVNVHRYLNSPFFKDHDFVLVENKKTGEVVAVDPTVADYLYIDAVAYAK